MRQWFCLIDSQQYGPISETELRAWAQQQRVLGHHLLWTEGMAEWAPAGSVGGLFSPASACGAAYGTGPLPSAAGQRNSFCTAGVVLGITSLTCACVPVMNFATAATGLILSLVGLRQVKAAGRQSGLGVAGLVMSIVGLAIAVLVSVAQLIDLFNGTWPPR